MRDTKAVEKQRLFDIIWRKLSPDVRYAVKFEATDDLRGFKLNKREIHKVIEILETHPDMMVRHEAAFVLLELDATNPRLLKAMRGEITTALSNRAKYDKSMVVRHETLEALGYVGDESCLGLLKSAARSRNKDIRESALVARSAS